MEEVAVGTVKLVGRLMEWSGKALQEDIITDLITKQAASLIEKQARQITLSWLGKLFIGKESKAKRQIAQEFAEIYKHQAFIAVMADQIGRFDQNVVIPLALDDRFYALPKFLVFDRFQNILSKTLSDAEGLPEIFDDVFGSDEKQESPNEQPEKEKIYELREEKISKFIELASREAADSAIAALDKSCEPRNKRFMAFDIKAVRNNIYLWGQNASTQWKKDEGRGHYYFDQRRTAPSKEDLPDVEKLKNRLEAKLLQTGVLGLVPQIESAVRETKISTAIRDHISVKPKE
jgi:hypothetical protein